MTSIADQFGIRSGKQVLRDLRTVAAASARGERFTFNLGSAGLLRPDISLPAYAGRIPKDGLSPIFNFFDRVGGGVRFGPTVKRSVLSDYRGGRLTYNEHDGTDFVCPPKTPMVAAAPGVLVATRDNWLRGGLTACVDHGGGVVTQYTHLTNVTAEIGQPLLRGEVLGLSGTSGLDMTQFFPWVPPHLHFTVFLHGKPIDPFVRESEERATAVWVERNEPRPSKSRSDDGAPESLLASDADAEAIERVAQLCRSIEIRDEIERSKSAATRVAIIEDSLHHDRNAWPDAARAVALRKRDGREVRLSLPLPIDLYRGARAADTVWTRPA